MPKKKSKTSDKNVETRAPESPSKQVAKLRNTNCAADAFCFFVHSAISLFILLPQNLIFIYDFLHTELLKFFYTFEFNSN